jgi:uncharacterized protein YwqG
MTNGAAPTGSAWKDLLEEFGLGAFTQRLAPLVRPAVRLLTTRSAGELALGASRVGGAPDVPQGFSWPHWRDKPLQFLAQIELERAGGGALPSSGHLLFFYDADQDAWGFDPQDRGSGVVCYLPAGTQLTRSERPGEGSSETRIAPCTLDFEFYEDLPEFETFDPMERELTEEGDEGYWDVRELLASGPDGAAAHKLLGHPNTIQGQMQLECQLASHGINCGTAAGYNEPRAKELASGAKDWRLLFQLDTDDNAELMWGDVGTLYFWIREQDLAELRFDRVWTVLQCH